MMQPIKNPITAPCGPAIIAPTAAMRNAITQRIGVPYPDRVARPRPEKHRVSIVSASEDWTIDLLGIGREEAGD
jgi:hypothetical protein